MSEGTDGDGKSVGDETPVRSNNAGREILISSAKGWMSEALNAWADDRFDKVAVLAPLAVEHLGKAVLWALNPVLLLPLTSESEPSLLALAREPDLTNPKLRTVGLGPVLLRAEQLLGGLAVDAKRRKRMVAVRNGAVHVGTSDESRNVLLDALAVNVAFLGELDVAPTVFYDDHHATVAALLNANRNEVGQRVTAKRARARARLRSLEEHLKDDYIDFTAGLESRAADSLAPEIFGHALMAVDYVCPECGSRGRLFGSVDVDPDVDFDVERDGDGWFSTAYVAGWSVTLAPNNFACNVCDLGLVGPAELAEGGLPNRRFEVDAAALGDGFDAAEFATFQYQDYD